MPEGDSVWLVARKLDRALQGATVTRSDFRVPRLATRDLAGRSVLEHATHGKHLLTRFSDDVTLHSHLLMDGSWKTTGPGKRLPGRFMPQVRVLLSVDSGHTAYGLKVHRLELVRTSEEHRVVGHLGPDPLRDDWDPAEAVRRLRAEPERPFVAALLDQRLMAGLGNLWVNELAFLTGVSPWTPIGEVDVERLVVRAADALHRSATTNGAYQVTTGNPTRGETHWVSGRQRKRCLRCGDQVQMVEEVANDPEQRRTWWCPTCQPGPAPDPSRSSVPRSSATRSASRSAYAGPAARRTPPRSR
ncbi:DNA-formamidopyrimidine glycosylase family protein [Nocardioides aequoreus]|uniref:DNA-formamidopyrimidine glycosylase family protein n=1 Tax=Nocardioides aequoreus TaxID=397278 RepID=UPI000A007756|nr:DNA-formamidopyrimidine glycosylase family protein [Nocardioides aequoreus]